MKQHRLTKEQIATIPSLYLGGMSSQGIALRFNVSSVAILGLLKRRNIKIRDRSSCQRKCTLNESAFDILTPEACYWIGFILADGCLFHRNGNPSLTVRLSDKDKKHVQKLKFFLGSSHKLLTISPRGFENSRPSIQLSVRSKKLVGRLEELGLAGLNSRPVKKLIKSRDFWRGVVDGDGTVGLYKKGEKKFEIIQLVGGKTLLENFCYFISLNFVNVSKKLEKHRSIYRVSSSYKQARNIIGLLYQKGDVALDRKANAALNIALEAARDAVRGDGIRPRLASATITEARMCA